MLNALLNALGLFSLMPTSYHAVRADSPFTPFETPLLGIR